MNNLFFTIVGIICGIFLAKLFTCNQPAPDCPEVEYPTDQTSQWKEPTPVKIEVVQGGKIPAGNVVSPGKPPTKEIVKVVYDTLEFETQIPYDICNHMVRTHYADTFHVGGGIVKAEASVFGTMERWRVTADSFPQFKPAVIEKKRVKGFYTFQLQGNQFDGIEQVGAGLMLQFKNDVAVEAGATLKRNVLPGQKRYSFEVGYKGPIRFGRRK